MPNNYLKKPQEVTAVEVNLPENWQECRDFLGIDYQGMYKVVAGDFVGFNVKVSNGIAIAKNGYFITKEEGNLKVYDNHTFHEKFELIK